MNKLKRTIEEQKQTNLSNWSENIWGNYLNDCFCGIRRPGGSSE